MENPDLSKTPLEIWSKRRSSVEPRVGLATYERAPIPYQRLKLVCSAAETQYEATNEATKTSYVTGINEPHRWENQRFAYVKTKTQISFTVTAKLISAFHFHYLDSTIPLLP